jgi:hypothetical protein
MPFHVIYYIRGLLNTLGLSNLSHNKKLFNLLTAMTMTVTLPDGHGVLFWIFTAY